MPDNPEKQPSDEVDRNQIQQSRTEGEAYQTSVSYMATVVADDGGVEETGDYLVGYATEEAEGMYHLVDGEFEWVEPDDENAHLEVIVADAGDRRFVPYCDVQVRLDGDGTDHGPVDLPFLWHPGVYHYGANVAVPEREAYDLHVIVEPPTFARHDEQNGDRFGDVAEVIFNGVTLPPEETEE